MMHEVFQRCAQDYLTEWQVVFTETETLCTEDMCALYTDLPWGWNDCCWMKQAVIGFASNKSIEKSC